MIGICNLPILSLTFTISVFFATITHHPPPIIFDAICHRPASAPSALWLHRPPSPLAPPPPPSPSPPPWRYHHRHLSHGLTTQPNTPKHQQNHIVHLKHLSFSCFQIKKFYECFRSAFLNLNFCHDLFLLLITSLFCLSISLFIFVGVLDLVYSRVWD